MVGVARMLIKEKKGYQALTEKGSVVQTWEISECLHSSNNSDVC